MMKVNIVSGDISALRSEAIITAINYSPLFWCGMVDGVIIRLAGKVFHIQLMNNLEDLSDGQAFLAKGLEDSELNFSNVIFVIDELNYSLHEIILAGLQEAEKNHLKTVSIPAIRMGVMLGEVEKTEEEVIEQMAMAIKLFLSSNPVFVKEINFVIYNNQEFMEKLDSGLRRLNPDLHTQYTVLKL